jgi:hypothetical protein
VVDDTVRGLRRDGGTAAPERQYERCTGGVLDKIDHGQVMETEPDCRLWRLRKLHQYVDAELRVLAANAGVELHFYYNGKLSYARWFRHDSEALAEAAVKRAELEREGWMFHW